MRWAALFLVTAVSGCALIDGLTGDDDDGNVIVPPPSNDGGFFGNDAGPPIGGPAQHLGRGCSLMAQDCPDFLPCVGFMGFGSQTEGWCSPFCDPADPFDPQCQDGFTGPGESQCIDDGTMTGQGLCGISCEFSMACPPDLVCEQFIDKNGESAFICVGDGVFD